MKNLWPEQFEENTSPSTKALLEEQSKLLLKLTNGMVDAEVVEQERLDQITTGLQNEFAYSFNLLGKFIDNYRFRVLSFAHDITLYPVDFQVDEQIGKELQLSRTTAYGYKTRIGEPSEVEDFLASVLNSQRIKNVVGSIIKLSK